MNYNILRALLFCPSPEGHLGLPAILWSPPGCGKTALVRRIAEMFGLPYYRLSPAERGDGYFGVVPVPGADGLLHYPPPADVVARFVDRGLLFVDEISTAPPALQAPLLGLVQLRTLGAYTFPRGVRVLGAANDVQHAAGGWDLAPALLNRFGHFEYSGLDAGDWADGLLGSFASQDTSRESAADLEARVMDAWPAASAQARGMVAGFVARNPALLHKLPVKGSADRSFPTRRTCEYAAVALASAQIHQLTESDTDDLMGGFVGRSWVTEFRQWSQMLDLPLPVDVLDNSVRFVHDDRRPDRTMVVLGACASLLASAPDLSQSAAVSKRKARGEVFWRLIGEVAKHAPDLCVSAARTVVMSGLFVAGQKNVLVGLLPVLDAGGMVR